jgi:hypothetical protein
MYKMRETMRKLEDSNGRSKFQATILGKKKNNLKSHQYHNSRKCSTTKEDDLPAN